jgi:pimeloyl-ACP methyl ester carboxylesterase
MKIVVLKFLSRVWTSTILFIHGWPLNHEMWEYQLNELPNTTFVAS